MDQVWATVTGPAVLPRTLPGGQGLREVGPDAYRMTITAGVAAIKGTYEGEVALIEQNPPGSFVLRASGAGAPGTVGADVRFSLNESATGGTDLGYDADAVVGGVIGGVGQRMLTGVAKKMAGQFFAAVDADIAGVRVPVPVERLKALGSGVGAPGSPLTYAGAAAGGRTPFQGRDFLLGALAGAGIALAGVAVGFAAGRR